jgi:AcrR family transcriptional regulator
VNEPVKPKQVRANTAEKLLYAAAAEFNEHGFAGTDTNRIARRAGFAPQTFYRWYEDKIDVFIRVYDYWEGMEAEILMSLLARHASDRELAEAMVEHHRAYRIFRRSLRQLSLEHPKVRAARAATRLGQIARLQARAINPVPEADFAAALLQLERLSDAVSEGELTDMGLDPEGAWRALETIIHGLRGSRRAL